MSSKGRDRPQRHQNATKWNPDKFKTDPTTKRVQSVVVVTCCERCTSTIEWKIKYGKYKPLSQPGKCTRCSEKRVKAAYHTVCGVCVEALNVCAKCGVSLASGIEAVRGPQPTPTEEARLQAELQRELKALPERKRRTFMRYLGKKEGACKPAKRGGDPDSSLADDENPDENLTLEEVRKAALVKLKEIRLKCEAANGDDLDDDLDMSAEDDDDEEEDEEEN